MQLSLEAFGLVPALALAYGMATRRERPGRSRLVAAAAALALIFFAFATELQQFALHTFLWAHLLQNVILAEWAPALLVLSVPPALAAAAGRVPALRLLTRPLVALPLWLGTYFAWHVPAAYDAALRSYGLIHLEHVCYLAAGVLFWWPVFQDEPWR